ncbi:hypothetical protein BT69DRAFT_1281154 [Atractiella rhizophila]|nr:hypothetical protein BT69DRAFT_1281154 [Atractiella rhizophila]
MSSTSSLYRSLLRSVPRTSPVRPSLRSFVASAPPVAVRSMVLYLQAEKEHEELMLRYHPAFSLTEEERIRLTARRVGLDVPEEVKPEERKEE